MLQGPQHALWVVECGEFERREAAERERARDARLAQSWPLGIREAGTELSRQTDRETRGPSLGTALHDDARRY